MHSPGGFSSRRIPHEAARAPKEPVLAIGGSAIIRSRDAKLRRVSLTNDDGTTVLTTVGEGIGVEITAWLPRRSAGALYRVRTTTGEKQEGWVSAASLEPVVLPRARKPVQPAPPPAKPVRVRAPRRAAAPAR
jgi:hypothetical protein